MLERYQTRTCSTRSASGLQTVRAPFNKPRSGVFVSAITSKASPERQRIQLLQAQSLQLAPQQQTQQLGSSNLSNRPAANGIHRSSKRLKVAVDVDEGTITMCLLLLYLFGETVFNSPLACSARTVPAQPKQVLPRESRVEV